MELKHFFYIIIFFAQHSYAQLETSQWYFGEKAGLDFTQNPPALLTSGAMIAKAGCASVADSNGSLLFYTKGDTIWNKLHQVMANGAGLIADEFSNQSSLIVRKPLSGNLYYVFTISSVPLNPTGLYYSIVDMSLAAGMGSVTVKNVLMNMPTPGKLTGTCHCNGTDVWIVSHDWNSNVFRSFLLTTAGINTVAAVTSSLGTIQTAIGYWGSMKISARGNKIGLAINTTNSVSPQAGVFELFDFNNSNGVISNSISLGNGYNYWGATGCEFSPDGSKFYGSVSHGTTTPIYQWDLCAGSPSAIVASQYLITGQNFGALQLAPNGKIYVAKQYQQNLDAINYPNAAGSSCGYASQIISLPVLCRSGLPNSISSLIKAPVTFTQDLSCSTASFSPPSYANPTISSCFTGNSVTGVKWYFGDPASGAANTSTLINPVHNYPSMGTYTVKLVMTYSGCAPDSIIQKVTLVNPVINVTAASVTCNGLATASVNVQPLSGPFSYTWMPSAQNGSVASGLSPGIYTVMVKTTGGSCISTLTANVVPPAQVSVVSVVDPSCTVSSASVTVSGGSGNYTYSWSPGAYTSAVVNNIPAGSYTVIINDTINQCSLAHTLILTTLSLPSLTITGNFTVCTGQAATLSATGANTYSWSNGSQGSTVQVTPTLTSTYTVNATGSMSNCQAVKTVTVIVSKCLSIEGINSEETAIQIFPNPNHGKFTIQTTLENFSVKIYNLTGELIYSDSSGASQKEIDLSEKPAGIYLLKVTRGKWAQRAKLIKE